MAGCAPGPTDTGSGYVPATPSYPPAPRSGQVDDYFGKSVADPYRWMENLDSAEVRNWVAAQNALSEPWLESIPARERLVERGRELWNYERYTPPVQWGGR